MTAYQLLCAVKLSWKCFDSRNRLRDMKSNCMPKITLIGWVWNFALFWQLISSYVLSSCHKKVLTQKNDLGIANLIVCQKSVWLVEFEILPYFDSLSVVTSCQVVIKKFWVQKGIERYEIQLYAKNQIDWWSLKFCPILTAYQLLTAVKLSKKKFWLQTLFKGLWN